MQLELDGNQLRIQRRDQLAAGFGDFASPRLIFVRGEGAFLQGRRDLNQLAKQILRQRFGLFCFIAFLVRAEIFKIAAVIENQKAPLVRVQAVNLIDARQSLAQPRAAANHLPELRFGTHFFEEHQIDALGHVDAGVHHIHRHGDLRFLFRLLEIVDNSLRVGVVADDALGEGSAVLRVELVESLQNELGVALVLREDNGFAQTVAAFDFDAAFH